MVYSRHVEFLSNQPDTHPQTGESMPETVVDMYVMEDEVLVWGWGWLNTFRPKEKSLDEIAETVIQVMRDEGLRVSYEDGVKELLAPEGPDEGYRRHVQLTKPIPEEHPETNEQRPETRVDLYEYPDRLVLENWGRIATTFRATGTKASMELTRETIDAYLKDGFSVEQDVMQVEPPARNDIAELLTMQDYLHGDSEPEDGIEM